jgi:hypothetical protein
LSPIVPTTTVVKGAESTTRPARLAFARAGGELIELGILPTPSAHTCGWQRAGCLGERLRHAGADRSDDAHRFVDVSQSDSTSGRRDPKQVGSVRDAMLSLDDLVELCLHGGVVPVPAVRGQDLGGLPPGWFPHGNISDQILDRVRSVEGWLPQPLSAQLGHPVAGRAVAQQRQKALSIGLGPLGDGPLQRSFLLGSGNRSDDGIQDEAVQSRHAQDERAAQHVGRVSSRTTPDAAEVWIEKQKTLHPAHRRDEDFKGRPHAGMIRVMRFLGPPFLGPLKRLGV